MSNAFIINAHQPYPFAAGRLNTALTDRITAWLERHGYETRHTAMTDDYDVAEEIEKHRWADLIVLQTPVNWMGVPWSFKKYMDEVYTAGMDGRLCVGDGRTAEKPIENYGAGGVLKNTKYMLSLTFNAPAEAFDDKNDWFFAGANVDDLFFPMHQSFKFFGLQSLPTFACFDVMKNPQIEKDFARLQAHLERHVPLAEAPVACNAISA